MSEPREMNEQEYSDRCTIELAKAIAENHKLKEKLRVAVEALELISKNKTDDCNIYTMGCDCDEEAIKALTKLKGGE